MTICCANGWKFMTTNPLVSTAGMRIPIDVPSTVPMPAEDARAAEHDTGDHLQGVLRVARDRGRREAGQRHHSGEPGERPVERVQLDHVAVDVDAGPRADSMFEPIR